MKKRTSARFPGWGSLPRPRLTPALLANTVLLALWAWLFRPVYPYLHTIFTRQEFRTNQLVLLGVLALIAVQVRKGQFQLALDQRPQLHRTGLALALFSAAAFLAAERWLDINTLSATLFALATYGLLALWMPPARWRQGLPAALLLVGVLPFGEHMETFAGYPLRLATARAVSHGLAALGVPNLGVDTILVFENGLSQVDSPCSGIKSLWTGSLFLLAATWVERRAINRRWMLAALAFFALLLAANLARVAVLILVGPVAGQGLLAEMLHVPLGVAGFVAACAAAAGLLRWSGPARDPQATSAQTAQRPRWLAPALALALIGLALLYTPPAQPAAAKALDWQLPPGLQTQEWPLSTEELQWLSDGDSMPVTAARWRFTWPGPDEHALRGSLLLVSSGTWRAHHRPERCFTVYGLEVQQSQPTLAAADFPLRALTLGSPGDDHPLYSAAYWLQSRRQVTDDFAVRMWDDLSPQTEPWVLVTLLFDGPADLAQPDAQALLAALRASVQRSLEEK